MSICDMPVEVLAQIFAFLDFETKLRARRVCSAWTHVLDRHILTHNIVLSNVTLPYVKKSRSNPNFLNRLSKLIVHGFDADLSKEPKSSSRSPFVFSPEAMIFEKERVLSVSPVSVHKSGRASFRNNYTVNSENNISTILGLNSDNLTSLVFSPGSLNSVKTLNLRGLALKSLTHLKISVSWYGQREYHLMRQFSQLKTPALSHLELEAGIYNLNNFVNDQTFIQLVQVLVSLYTPKLKKLTLKHVLSANFDWHLTLLPLTLASSMTPDEYSALEAKIARIQVEDLSLKLIPRDGIMDYELGLQLLNSQKSLKNLHMEVFPGRDSHDFKFSTNSAILRNKDTLSHLEISCNGYGDRCWLLANYIEDIWQSLNHCLVLQSLDLSSFWIRRLLFPFPLSIKNLVMGLIRPSVLPEIKAVLNELATFQFSGFAHEDPPDVDSATVHLVDFLGLPSLRLVRWRAEERENLDYLQVIPGIKITSTTDSSKYSRTYEYIVVRINSSSP